MRENQKGKKPFKNKGGEGRGEVREKNLKRELS